MRLLRTSAVVAIGCLSLGGAAGTGHADPLKCARGINSAHAKYEKARAKIVLKCQDRSVNKGTPASPTSCPTTADDAKLLTLELKLRAQIAAVCGGADKACDGIGDESLASIGWDIGACPDLDGEGCTNVIANCDDVATCVACIADETLSKGAGIAYDQLDDGEFATGSAVNDCQRALGKETGRYLKTRAKLLGKCWDKVQKGSSGFTDPPGCPATDAKLVDKLDRLRDKLTHKVCKACGGGGDADKDGACDSPGGALSAGTIGFEPDCSDIIVPSTAEACDHPVVTTLDEALDCTSCVVDFMTDCDAAASVPVTTSYPAGCSGAP